MRRRRGRPMRQPERGLCADHDHHRNRARCVDLLSTGYGRRHRPYRRAGRGFWSRAGAHGMTTGTRVESVLCVRRDDIFPDGAWHGFVSEGLERHQQVIRERHFFKPRAEVEDDPTYQQIIPYVVFHHGDRYFLTHRLRASAERRLRKQYSLGIGGHINPGDLRGGDPTAHALITEWEEGCVGDGRWQDTGRRL